MRGPTWSFWANLTAVSLAGTEPLVSGPEALKTELIRLAIYESSNQVSSNQGVEGRRPVAKGCTLWVRLF
jgi:hypothetical protein